MWRRIVLGGTVALLAAGAAHAAPPPGAPPPPTGAPVSPVALAVPTPGKAVVTKVVFSARVAPGTKPTVTPIGYGRPAANLRVASAETKPTYAKGRVSITYWFIVGDVSKRSLSRAAEPSVQVGFVSSGPTLEQVSAQLHKELDKIEACSGLKARIRGLYARVIYGNPGDQAAAMWIEGFHRMGCK